MEVINPRSALLSNFEVLALLHDLEREHLERAKTALRIKKEEDGSGTGHPVVVGSSGGNPTVMEEVCENLRTIEVETIRYLSAEYQPTSSQTAPGITKLVKDLSPFDLTKAEKLQVVNLAPTEPVELYVIVEELEDRLGDRMGEILAHVRASVQPANPATLARHREAEIERVDTQTAYADGAEAWSAFLDVDAAADEVEFDDTDEGVGLDGDLEMNDD